MVKPLNPDEFSSTAKSDIKFSDYFQDSSVCFNLILITRNNYFLIQLSSIDISKVSILCSL